MCVPLGGRRGRPGRPSVIKKYPEYWINNKRVVKEDGIFSIDGKTLVKLAPRRDCEYIIPEHVTRVLVGAFTECSCLKVKYHPGVKTRVSQSMFTDNWSLEIIDQQGRKLRWDSPELNK